MNKTGDKLNVKSQGSIPSNTHALTNERLYFGLNILKKCLF